MKNTIIIGTTHSPVVINELNMEELIDISGKRLSNLDETNKKKLNTFLHPGRSELLLADNIILVEGYTEELLLNNYLYKNNFNWTIVNVAGIMFEPYIELSTYLDKKVIVISDNDKSLSENLESSERFNNLKSLCDEKNIKLLEVDNTLETDLYNNEYLKMTSSIKSDPINNVCFECGEKDPQYISINNAIFICKDCVVNHFSFSQEISQIIINDLYSLNMDNNCCCKNSTHKSGLNLITVLKIPFLLLLTKNLIF
mgnify:CR=1 FL=1